MTSERKLTYYPDGICSFCKHFHEKISIKGYVTCDAFPDGIPFIIGAAQFDHRNPYPNDNGITFEKNQDEEIPIWVESLYVDNATKLKRGFQRLRRHSRANWYLFREGKIDKAELIEALSTWLLLDWTNTCWTLGKEDGEWYKLENAVWIRSEAPFTIEELNEVDALLGVDVREDRRFYLQPGKPNQPDIKNTEVRRVFETVAAERIAVQQSMKALFEELLTQEE